MANIQALPTAARIQAFGITIFSEISALARGVGAVNLGQGFPDFDGPEAVLDAAAAAIGKGHNQYAITFGEPELRQAIAEHSARFYAQQADHEQEITVTSGATEAIFCAALAFINPGDEVIVFEPCYDSYVPAITFAGGIPVPVALHAPDFRFDPDELRRAVTPRTRAIIINTPHNPTGTVLTSDELGIIADLCCRHNLIAITDEVYEHIVFDGAAHQRLATFPGMADRTLTISSGGKSFSVTGWKIGWAIGPKHLQTALRRVHQFSVFATATPLQHAIAHALRLPDSYFRELRAAYQARRDALAAMLQQAGFATAVPQGSYFVVANVSGFGRGDAIEFNRWLIREIGVAAIPVSAFYLRPGNGDHLLRFCFCKRWETLEEGGRRLLKIAEKGGG
ncbi:MAG: aminotransferase class I/II-fold pyridoxal phosphate-dependent enzyme [Chlorobi bacterium]|nr:MAG: Aminotransferase [Chlorobi bacterium OLB7]MBK8910213.1 aminotransferase class I/II-fold pyridoxal phosphate-dependent enzyme [Chlorobiota bacterium]MBX7217184.1 aminotransferase class I/II-fold pyridoxal phosphate-dependent enzyme [Candidatus Kapabacteria bacterium]